MVFNSIFFIFCLLPVFMLIYYLVPGKLRNLLLFLGSLIFYAWGEPVYVILMLFSSVFNYYMGTELERLYYDDKKQKLNLVFAIIINLGILVFFNHFEKKGRRNPTAMEIQMDKYEEDMVDAYVKSSDRRGKSLDVED